MNLIQQSKNFIQHSKRPIGISLVMLYMGIFAGLAPLSVSLIPIQNEGVRLMVGLSIGEQIATLLFALLVLGSGIGAWFGNRIARYVFLIGITLYCANITSSFIRATIEIFNYPEYIPKDDVSPWPFIQGALRQLVLIGISWWAFHTKKANRFYQSDTVHLSKAVIS